MIKKIYKKLIPEKIRIQIHVVLRKINVIFLQGNNFYCCCCNKSFRKFLKKGNGIEFRENAVCPNCGSLERTRLLYSYLKNETSIFNSKLNILHISPEYALKKHLISNENYIDIDLNPNLARFNQDLTKLSFKNDQFDYVICSHVLGHIPEEKKAINEIFRVLKKNGIALILVLMNPKLVKTLEDENFKTSVEKLENYGEFDLERLYGIDFSERLKSENIKVEQIDYRLKFTENEQIKFSLGDGKRELIFKCSKIY